VNSTTPADRMRSAITDALYELETRVVRPLSDVVYVENALIDPKVASIRTAMSSKTIATALGSLARIMLAIEEAAK
jgi:hypothetical protein